MSDDDPKIKTIDWTAQQQKIQDRRPVLVSSLFFTENKNQL
jgi:hypothetical protein